MYSAVTKCAYYIEHSYLNTQSTLPCWNIFIQLLIIIKCTKKAHMLYPNRHSITIWRDDSIQNINIAQRIAICSHSYHHNGFMATPTLGTQDVHLHTVWKDCIVKSPRVLKLWTVTDALCIKWTSCSRALHPIQESAQTACTVGEVSKG